MKAVKENKEYDITETQKAMYLNEGYDIVDDKGKVLEYSPKKTITYNEHIKIVDELKKASENKELEAEVEKLTKSNAELTDALKVKEDELKKANAEIEKITKELEKNKAVK